MFQKYSQNKTKFISFSAVLISAYCLAAAEMFAIPQMWILKRDNLAYLA